MEIDHNQRIDDLRQKAALGTLTLEEGKMAIEWMRSQRLTATTKAKKKGKSAKVIDTSAMLDEIGNL